MARSENNLTAVFTDTANAIREKTGDSALIIPRDFADAIANIGGGGELLPKASYDGVDYYQQYINLNGNKGDTSTKYALLPSGEIRTTQPSNNELPYLEFGGSLDGENTWYNLHYGGNLVSYFLNTGGEALNFESISNSLIKNGFYLKSGNSVCLYYNLKN